MSALSKNLLLLNIIASNVLRNNYDDDANMGETLSMVSTTNGVWIHRALGRP